LIKNKEDERRFEFGKNWSEYVRKAVNQERVDISRRHMLAFLGRTDLAGTSFLDIGCGSGLHSFAAYQSGANSVFGFDYDPESVAATEILRERASNPEMWHVEQGSVLDEEYLSKVPMADLVYSWGVLHHTGDVWRAIRNAAGRVAEGGQLYLALYSADMHINPTPVFWLAVKRRYVSSGQLMRRCIELWYILRFSLGWRLTRLPAFVRKMREYKKSRGMDQMTDIRDWLGGWPMEFVWDDDAVQFVEKLGFRLESISKGEANTEFLFRKLPVTAS
jgi:2-polyprenyl-6-hydroxyphenyl methylase/3-demethylubiquinone-9 3-methyltransferase